MNQRLQRYWFQFCSVKSKIGLWGALKYAVRKVVYRRAELAPLAAKPDPVRFYDFIYPRPFGELCDGGLGRTINWVIPDFSIGSGGHLTIFRVVKKLEETGFVCRINIDGDTHFSNGEEARKCIRENFFPIEAEVGIGREELRPAAATFATGWTTAYTVRDFMGSGKKYYFVQDFEPFFFAHGSDYIFAEETYRLGLKAITAGDWLAEKLAHEYGMETVPFGFSYDAGLYHPQSRRDPHIKRVFYYGRPVTPRRAFELGLLILARVHELNPQIEFVLAGWDVSTYQISFPYSSAGVLPPNELAALYSQCDVALVLSFSNLSLIPLEAMACRCAVVSNGGANVEWLLDGRVARIADSNPEALSDAIVSLFEDAESLESLKQEGLRYAQSTSWDEEVEKISMAIQSDF